MERSAFPLTSVYAILVIKHNFCWQFQDPNNPGQKIEYRVWNPFRSKLGAAILGGVDNIWIKPGTKLLYLGAASGTTVSHCSDIVGPVWIFQHRNIHFSLCKIDGYCLCGGVLSSIRP